MLSLEHGSVVEEELRGGMVPRGELFDAFELDGDLSQSQLLTGGASELEFAANCATSLKHSAIENKVELELGMLGDRVHGHLHSVSTFGIIESSKLEVIPRRRASGRRLGSLMVVVRMRACDQRMADGVTERVDLTRSGRQSSVGSPRE